PHPDRQAFAAEFIKDVQRSKHLAVIGAAMNKIIRPDMIPVFRPQPDTGSVIQPQPALLWLPRWHFQPLPPPQALDPLVVHLPSGIPQQSRNPTIAIAAILSGQFDQVGVQAIFIRSPLRQLALRGAMLAQHPGQARRSETPNSPRTWSMQARRRAGLRSFAARTCGSPSRLRQDQLVQGQIRNSTPEPFIILLKPLQFLQLIYAHPTILLAPAVISLFDNADPPDRIKTGQALPHQNLNLPQLR